jgi:endonuclease/exonuclease/phosphatase (EEP) superfamily protein YafD
MRRWLTRLVEAYVAGLLGWALLRALAGDRWWWIFVLNTFALYLFVPLPAAALVALRSRRRRLWVAVGTGLALAGWCFGTLWLPRWPPREARGPTLTALTFNTLGFSQRPEATLAAILAAGADVVALQELNPEMASVLRAKALDQYPYQILDPQPGVTGMGVISRYPLARSEETLPGAWAGQPQLLRLDLSGVAIELLNIHARATDITSADRVGTIRERERQAQALAAFAAGRSAPLVVLGDFNTGDQSVAYATVAGALRDAWREVGAGIGNTFPGAASSGSSRTKIGGVYVPQWLVRIDYIFHSHHWQTLEASIGPWDGVSDHRPVLAKLALRRPLGSTP